MKKYKFSNKNRNVVISTADDINFVSFEIAGDGPNQKELKDWLEKGNKIEAENPEPQEPVLTLKEKLDKLGLDPKELKKLLKDTPEA